MQNGPQHAEGREWGVEINTKNNIRARGSVEAKLGSEFCV